jgi:hypothetical protein
MRNYRHTWDVVLKVFVVTFCFLTSTFDLSRIQSAQGSGQADPQLDALPVCAEAAGQRGLRTHILLSRIHAKRLLLRKLFVMF